jgi:hypothetical protein
MLLAEANQWPEDAVAYFGSGDECHMAFHFPVMPRLFMALQMEDRFPILDILQQTPGHPGAVPMGGLPPQPRRAARSRWSPTRTATTCTGLRPDPRPASTSESAVAGPCWATTAPASS